MRKLWFAIVLLGSSIAHAQPFNTIYNPAPGFTLDKPEIVQTPQGTHLFVPNRDLATGRTRLDWCRPIGTSLTDRSTRRSDS